MTKKVTIRRLGSGSANADAWVDAGAESRQPSLELTTPVPPEVEMKRLTIDIPVDLHRRVKSQCAVRGVKMADVVRDLLNASFPS